MGHMSIGGNIVYRTRYHFVHESYPYERWRGHSTIFLHVSTRRDDLEGSRVEGFGAFRDFFGTFGTHIEDCEVLLSK